MAKPENEVRIRVFLVDDDEDDYVLTRRLLSEVTSVRFELDWTKQYEEAREAIRKQSHDVYLVDYRLGERDGLHLLRESVLKGCRAPIILLTGLGDREVDLQAMRAGAADYLIKSQLAAPLLERSIRYALERRQSLEALHREETRHRELIASVPGIVWRASAKTFHFRFVSKEAENLLGYPIQKWIQEPSFWKEHVHPEDRERVVRAYQKIIQEKIPQDFEYRGIAADGRKVWLRNIVRIDFEDGVPDELIGVMVDITKQKQVETEFLRLATAVEQASESVIIADAEGTIEYVNPSFERVSGHARSEALGKNLRFVQGQMQDESFHESLWSTIQKGNVWKGHMINKRPDGRECVEEASITPIRNAANQIIHYVVVKRDVTHERQLEGHFHQAQKMEAVGQLAGGIAHDLNNIIGVVIGYSDLIIRKLQKDDPLRSKVDSIKTAAQKGSQITRQLLAFSRRQLLQPRVIDLNLHLQKMIEMIQRLMGEHIQVTPQYASAEACIKVDPNYLDQVIINLAVNARDAMPQGGSLTLGVAVDSLSSNYLEKRTDAMPGTYAILSVSDTGVGMTPEVRSHVFEPFFTTKGPGKGTGLGLSTVYGVVKQSNGHIDLESELGQGTTFRVYFPYVTGGQDARPAQGEAPALPRGSETILIVEDEEPLRRMAHEILTDQGYTIFCAANGDEAVRFCQSQAVKVDLLFTDIVMPKMGGVETADRLMKINPKLNVLFTSGHASGYAQDPVFHRKIQTGEVHFIPKPYEPMHLIKKVHEVLRGKEAASR
jgi:two-component system, cell cycle sensor histidine kinase and response regulator CckA